MPKINRIASLLDILRRHNCTHLLVTDVIDVEYLSGFSSSHAYLLVAPRKKYLFTDFRYQEAAERFCARGRQWEFVLVKEGDYSGLAARLPARSKVGFQSDALTVEELRKLSKAAARARLIPIAAEITDVAIVKTPEEIGAMRRAAAIGDRALPQLLAGLRPGVTESATARALERLCSEMGSEKPSFDTIVLFGARSAMPHGRPGPARLRKGDFVLFDFGCTVEGFCSDMTRTAVFGKASPRQRALYALVEAAQAAARKAARAGMPASALDAVARDYIARAGYGDAFGHGLGHGVGRRIHERPRLNTKMHDTLQEGAVVTIEPGIYLPGEGGVRIEDMVVLTQKGSRLLTSSPRGLIEV